MENKNLGLLKKESEDRLINLLKYSLGEIVPYLEDKDVIEVMLNPDGMLWIDTLSKGMLNTGLTVKAHDALRVIQTVATHVDKIVDVRNPILSAELPESGSRFEGIIPPIVINPTFTIRKKGLKIFTLDDYISRGTLTERQKEIILEGVKKKLNLLIIGATSTGKTTFTNAIINEISKTDDRLVIIEDTQEIQSASPNTVFLRTSEFITMRDCLKSTMRLRPDRIIVGEIRDEAGLDLITAWNSGHSGGVSTIHAGSIKGGLKQLERYIQRVSVNKQQDLIADTVNIVIVLKRIVENGNVVRKVNNIARIKGFDEKEGYIIEEIN